MAKIPVGATIAHAYRFTFSNFFNILGASWLAYALPALIFYFAAPHIQSVAQSAQAQDFVPLLSALPFVIFFYLILIIMNMMPWIAVTEKALGQRSGPIFFYFSLGKPVWRILGALILFMLVIITGSMIAGLLGGFLGVFLGHALAGSALSEAYGTAIVALVVSLAILALYAAITYASMRFVFLLLPVTIAEQRMGLWRAWKLGRGNFWRFLIVFLAIMLPIILVQYVLMFSILGTLEPPPGENAPPEAAIVWMMGLIDHISQAWYLILPAFALVGIFVIGLLSGAATHAYRALVPAEEKPGMKEQ